MSDDGGGAIGRREVAVRCFAAEYDDATLEYSEGEEDRAPNYVVTPTGARINRLFVVGVLTEVEPVSDDVLRARVVDPTGAFVVYAGQYQPDAKTFLERADPPQFVAVTGKARTFEPDDADVVYTSVRPESINAVDTDTRERWTVQTAEFTLERVGAHAAALDREERGDALGKTLLDSGVEPALAAGIPRAIDHYGTTGAYLAAIREMALQAAEVVAGERDEVDPLELAPDEGGSADVDQVGGVDIEPATAEGGEAATGVTAGTEAATDGTATVPAGGSAADTEAGRDESGTPDETGTAGAAEADGEPAASAEGGESSDEAGGLGDFDDFGRETTGTDATRSADGDDSAAAGGGDEELYEMDDAERSAVEEEYGTDFSTGNEVGEAGEADIETPGPIEGDAVDGEAAGEPAGDAEAATGDETGVAAADDDERAAEEAEPDRGEEAVEVDLEDAVVAAMDDLDTGEGADREAVVEQVADEHDVDRDAVEDAIQDALMGGRCYEPQDGRLKAI